MRCQRLAAAHILVSAPLIFLWEECTVTYLTLNCCTALRGGVRYRAAALCGPLLYLAVSGRPEIDVLDQDLQHTQTLPVCRSYSALCFDTFCNCFWAFSPACPGKLFRLRREDLQETLCLTAGAPDGTPLCPWSLSCEDEQTLLLCSRFGMLRLSKDGGCPLTQPWTCRTECRAAQSLPCGLLTALSTRSGGSLHLYDSSGCETACCSLPVCLFPEDLACGPSGSGYLLASLAGGSCLLHLCACSLPHPCPQPDCPSCAGDACHVVQSVACMETALSIILSAEGEHMQAVIRSGAAPAELLSTSEHTRKTIDSIVCLEQLLLEKLRAARDFCIPHPCAHKKEKK